MQVVISGVEGCGSRINGTMGPGPLTHSLGPRTPRPRPRGRDCPPRDRASDLPWGAFTAQTPGAPPPLPPARPRPALLGRARERPRHATNVRQGFRISLGIGPTHCATQ